jgi:hypothetical protein
LPQNSSIWDLAEVSKTGRELGLQHNLMLDGLDAIICVLC